MLSVFSFILGTLFGSLANCAVYRLETKKNFIVSRSMCPHCKHTLGVLDLIPIFSFLFLRGKCRYCRDKISLEYPLVEIIMGGLFVLLFFLFGSNPLYLIFLFINLTILSVIFLYDLKHFLIPDIAIYLGVGISFVYNLYLFIESGNKLLILHPILAGFLAGLFFFCFWFFSKGKWMGFGDVNLAFYMGIMLGPRLIIPALFSSFFLGAIIGIVAILVKNKDLKSKIPFGPFLVTGTLVSILWGNDLINWYISLL